MPHSRNDAYARTLFRIRCIGRNRPFRINFSSPPSVREWWRSIENARVIRSLVPDKSVRDFLPYRPPLFAPSTRERRLSAVGIVGARERETFYRLRLLEDASRADERARRRESPRAARTRAIRVAGLRYEMGENGRRRIR